MAESTKKVNSANSVCDVITFVPYSNSPCDLSPEQIRDYMNDRNRPDAVRSLFVFSIIDCYCLKQITWFTIIFVLANINCYWLKQITWFTTMAYSTGIQISDAVGMEPEPWRIRCFDMANQNFYFAVNKPCDWLKQITWSVSANRMVCLLVVLVYYVETPYFRPADVLNFRLCLDEILRKHINGIEPLCKQRQQWSLSICSSMFICFCRQQLLLAKINHVVYFSQ